MFKFKSIIAAVLAVTSVSSFGFTREDLQAMSPEDIAKNFNISIEDANTTSKFWNGLSVYRVDDAKSLIGAGMPKILGEGHGMSFSQDREKKEMKVYIESGLYYVKCDGEKGIVSRSGETSEEEIVFEPFCVFYASERKENRYPEVATPAMEKRAEELRNMSELDLKLMVNKDGLTYMMDNNAKDTAMVWKGYPTVVPEGASFKSYYDHTLTGRNYKEVRYTLLNSKEYTWEMSDGIRSATFTCGGFSSTRTPGYSDPICLFYDEMLKVK